MDFLESRRHRGNAPGERLDQLPDCRLLMGMNRSIAEKR